MCYPVELEIFNQKQNCKRASTKYLHLGASELSYRQVFWYGILLWTHIVLKCTLILLYFNCGVAFHSHVEMNNCLGLFSQSLSFFSLERKVTVGIGLGLAGGTTLWVTKKEESKKDDFCYQDIQTLACTKF